MDGYAKSACFTEKKSNQFALKCILVFFFIYEINCSTFGLPTWITTRRVAIVFMAVVLLFRVTHQKMPYGPARKTWEAVSILHVFLLCCSLLILIAVGRGTGDHILDSVVKFFFIAMLGSFVFFEYFHDHDELLKILLVVTVIQAIFILLFAFVQPLQTAVDAQLGLLEFNTNLHSRGYLTGLACATSKGTLKMTLGMAACIYFILKDQHRLRYILCFYLIAFTSTAIARTGLFISLLGLGVILMRIGKKSILKFVRLVGICFLLAVIFWGFFVLFDLLEDIRLLFQRLINLKEYGLYSEYFSIYLYGTKTAIPELSIKTLLGTGTPSGMSGNGVYVNVDGGFLRLYVAYGLPLAVIFYIFMAVFLTRPLRSIGDRDFLAVMLFLLLYILIGEFKEFFIYENYAVCVYLALLLLYDKRVATWRRPKRPGGDN